MTRATAMLASFAVVAAAFAECGDVTTWDFDLMTEGEDVFATSPEPASDAAAYAVSYEITLLEVRVSWNSNPAGTHDVTDDVRKDDRIGNVTLDGPLPVTAFDEHIFFPEDQKRPAMAGDLLVTIDDAGFGQIALTNVVLGDYDVDLGPPFGVQTVTIEEVRAVGHVSVTELDSRADVDRDCDVDVDDLVAVILAWGPCPGEPEPCPQDVNGDGVIDIDDLVTVILEWG